MKDSKSKVNKVEDMIEWCKANDYPYKFSGYSIFWQTPLQTGEINFLTDEVKWHRFKYFNRVKEK